MTRYADIRTRLLAKSMFIPFTSCQIWIGASVPNGYGVIYYHGKQHYTHRIAYLLEKGLIPNGMFVCHHCDNPSCINADHLFLGTAKDNVADMISKNRQNFIGARFGNKNGRGLKGAKNGRAKLTIAQVDSIKKMYLFGGVTQKDVAKKFGVKQAQISAIIRNKSWVI